jgi:hypothetical protein
MAGQRQHVQFVPGTDVEHLAVETVVRTSAALTSRSHTSLTWKSAAPGRGRCRCWPADRLAGGGTGLPPLDTSRLRATWLAQTAALIGLPAFLHAAGISCCQQLGDIAAGLDPGTEEQAITLLGAAAP